jgi:hypothetical protein
MKANPTYILAGIASAVLLAGCCTSRHAKPCEYKVIEAGNANAAVSPEQAEALLNKQAKEGWVFIQADGGRFYFKRARKYPSEQ